MSRLPLKPGWNCPIRRTGAARACPFAESIAVRPRRDKPSRAPRGGTDTIERHVHESTDAGRRSPRAARAGLSLIEAMVSLAIMSMLMAAAAAAFTASARAVSANADFFRATQAARVSMNQVLLEVRKADSVQVSSNRVDIIRPAELLTAGEVFRRFQFDSANQRLTLQIFTAGNVGGPVYELASNVTAATFGPAVMGQDYNNATVVQRVPVMLTVTVGSNVVTLNGSSGPRRSLQY